jgi:hypothetical protein
MHKDDFKVGSPNGGRERCFSHWNFHVLRGESPELREITRGDQSGNVIEQGQKPKIVSQNVISRLPLVGS